MRYSVAEKIGRQVADILCRHFAFCCFGRTDSWLSWHSTAFLENDRLRQRSRFALLPAWVWHDTTHYAAHLHRLLFAARAGLTPGWRTYCRCAFLFWFADAAFRVSSYHYVFWRALCAVDAHL